MTIKDRKFETYISEAELDKMVRRLADEVSRDYSGADLVACPVLTGAYMFAADLLRRMTVECEVNFVKYTSYAGVSSTGKIECGVKFPASVEGRDVLIVEDVVDSGLSMQHMLKEVHELRPRSVRVCALFFKPRAFRGDFRVDYIGKEIGNEFIVGYGMDYNGLGRTLPQVMVEVAR